MNKGHDPGNLSEEELVQLQKRSLEAQQKAEADLDQLVTIMKAEGIVVQDTTRDSLAGCLVARLDAAHYPERVVASITMQYFKQPEFPHAMVKSLINCNDKVPLELLVNVDHPKVRPHLAGTAALPGHMHIRTAHLDTTSCNIAAIRAHLHTCIPALYKGGLCDHKS